MANSGKLQKKNMFKHVKNIKHVIIVLQLCANTLSDGFFFLSRTPEIASGHNTRYSYAHAHIAHIKNAREHCIHVTDNSGWRFSTTHVMKYLHGS